MHTTPVQPTGSEPSSIPGWAYLAATLAALLLGGTALVRQTFTLTAIQDSDLTNYFLKSATYVINGDPWHMYRVRATLPSSFYPNFNPPLSIFLMAPLLRLARAAGVQGMGATVTLVALPFTVLIPLLGYLVQRVLLFLSPGSGEMRRLFAFLLVVVSPLSWQAVSTWHHVEQPLMLCFLLPAVLALQQGHERLAGVLMGLALLTRTTAMAPLIALATLLLTGGRWGPLLRCGGLGALVAGIGLAPFFIVDRVNTTYSLITWRGADYIGRNSVWTVFAYNRNDHSLRHLMDAAARHLDSYALVVFVVATALYAARRFRITAYEPGTWAVLAVAAMAVPLLSKSVWPYYYLEPFILLLCWEFASLQDTVAGGWTWPVLSILFLAVTATLSPYISVRTVGAGDRIAVGLVQSGAMLAFVAGIWRRLRASGAGIRRPSDAHAATRRAAGR